MVVQAQSELLKLMVAHNFECLLTVDHNLELQQNVIASEIAVVVIAARTNRLRELRPIVPRVLEALAGVLPGKVVRVSL